MLNVSSLNRKIVPITRKIGNYLIPGDAGSVLLSHVEELAYITRYGSSVVILNITDPLKPTSIVTSITTGGVAQPIAKLVQHSNILALVNIDYSIALVDITNIFNPIFLSKVITPYPAFNVIAPLLHPNLLAVTMSTSGISLIDITNISNPVLISNIRTAYSADFIATLEQYPNLLAVADSNAGITLIDIANTTHPILVSSLKTAMSSSSITTLAQYPNLLAVADYSGGLTLVDVINVSNPILVSNVKTEGAARNVAVLAQHNNLLAVADGYYTNYGISLVDIANIYSPTVVAHIPTMGLANFIILERYANLLLFVDDFGLNMIEINYESILQRNEIKLNVPFQTEGYARHITALMQYPNILAIADYYAGVSLVNLTNISKPNLLSNVPTLGNVRSSTELIQYNNLIAMAESSGGVSLVDITNIASPILLSNIKMSDARYIVALQNTNILAVVNYNIGIAFVNITNVSKAVVEGNVNISGIKSITALANYPNILAVSKGAAGISLIDVSNISNPILVSNIEMSYALYIAALVQYPNILAVAMSTSGISLIDIVNTSSPILISSIQTSDARFITEFAQYPNLLAVADFDAGIKLVDITNTFHPILVSSVKTSDTAWCVKALEWLPEILVVADDLEGISTIEFKSLALWAAYLPVQKVGRSINEKLFIYKINPSELLISKPDTVVIKKIDSDGITRYDIPYWLNIERETLILNGMPPKETTGQHFAIELNFNATSWLTKEIGNYKPLFHFDVVSSLSLNRTITNYNLLNGTKMTLPTLAIDALAQLVTLTLTVSPAGSVQFIITDDFGAIKPTFIPAIGIFQAFGAVPNLNSMLQHLRYPSINPLAASAPTITVALDDNNLNYPTKDKVDMSFFRQNYAPVCSKQIIAVSSTTASNLDYTINPYTCSDVDDSVDGTKLTYSAGVISADTINASNLVNATYSALPKWMSFFANQMRFSGYAPAMPDMIFIRVNASDGYATDFLTYKFTFVRIFNQLPRIVRQIPKLVVKVGQAQNISFSPADYFIDPDGDDMLVTFSNVPTWLTITPSHLAVRAQNITETGNFSLVLQATDNSITSDYENSMVVEVVDWFNRQTVIFPYTYSVRINQPPKAIKPLPRLVAKIGQTRNASLIPSEYFMDPDGDDMVVTFSNVPAWLTIVPPQLTLRAQNTTAESFALTAQPSSDEGNIFSDHEGSINVVVNGSLNDQVLTVFYAYIIQGNQPPRIIRPIQKLVVKTGQTQELFLTPTDYFMDPDGDDMVVTFASVPEWLTINPPSVTISSQNITFAQSFALKAEPKPIHTGAFSDYESSFIVEVSDVLNQTITTPYAYSVGGDSVATLVISYGSTIVGALGTAYGFFAYRNQIYNAIAWDRYRYKPMQFDRQVDELSLFAIKSDSLAQTGLELQHCVYTSIIARWSTKLQKELDEPDNCYFKHEVLADPADIRAIGPTTFEAINRRKEITTTTVSFVTQLPEHTILQKAKAKILNKIPKIFNDSFGKLLAKFGIKMSPNYFAIFEPINGFPSWLKYNQRTGILKLVDIEQDDPTIFDVPIVLRFMNDESRILEEITFIVRDEESFTEIFPNIRTVASASSSTLIHPLSRSLHDELEIPEEAMQQICPKTESSRAGAVVKMPLTRHEGDSDSLDRAGPSSGYGTSLIKPDIGFWGRYYVEGVNTLLPLRLSHTDVKVRKALILDDSLSKFHDCVHKTEVIPALTAKPQAHWVGLVISRLGDYQLRAIYVDSENNPIPEVLKTLLFRSLSRYSIMFEQQPVDSQSYNDNCGSELIENFAKIVTRHRVHEKVVPEFHSWLLERALWQKAGHMTESVPLITFSQTPVHSSRSIPSFTDPRVPESITLEFHSKLGYKFTYSSKNKFVHLTAIMDKYGIKMSIEDALTPHGTRELARYTHPDNDGNSDDFNFIWSLKEPGTQLEVKQLAQTHSLFSKLHTANIAIKTAEVGVNWIKAYEMPTQNNIEDAAFSSLHLVALYSGMNSLSIAATAASVGYSFYSEDFSTALIHSATALGSLITFSVLTVVAPKAAVACGIGLVAYSAYQVVEGIYEILHQDNELAGDWNAIPCAVII